MNITKLLPLLALLVVVDASLLVSSASSNWIKRADSACFNVTNAANQCQFVAQNCYDDDIIGRINYLKLYYCNPVRITSLLTLLLCLFMGFYSIGVTASEFLSPNLLTISKFLKLSDNLAGLTLLAMGNGSPDILSTYKAMNFGSGTLAISELMGAAFFITTVVIGCMGILHPFKIPKRLYLRDVSFLIVTTSLILISVVNAYISIFNGIILIAVYIFYVIYIIINHSLSSRKTLKRLREERIRNNYVLNHYRDNDMVPDNNDADYEEGEFNSLMDNLSNLPSVEEISLHDFNEYDEDYQRELTSEYDVFRRNNDDVTLSNKTFGFKQLINELSKHQSRGITLNNERSLNYFNNQPIIMTTQSDDEDNSSIDSNDGNNDYNIEHGKHSPFRPSNKCMAFFIELYPPLLTFPHLNLRNKILLLMTLPINLLLKLTIPVHRNDENENEGGPNDNFDDDIDIINPDTSPNDKLIHIFQIFTSSIFINLMLVDSFLHFIIINSILGISSLLLFKYNLKMILPFLGFLVSIIWISVFATEIISLLKMFSVIFNIEDEILGLTVFALGNSVGDFISNYTIAKMGMPIMAFGACFGSPILSLCSMGLSSLVILTNNENYSKTYVNSFGYVIQSNRTLVILTLSLIFNLVLQIFLLMHNNWFMDRKIGLVLISNWIIVTTFCCVHQIVTDS